MQIGALKYLVPAEGSVVTSSLVMMDYDMDMGLSFPQVLDRTKRQILEKAEVHNMQQISNNMCFGGSRGVADNQCFLV